MKFLSGSSLAISNARYVTCTYFFDELKAIVITLIFRAFESSSMDRWINDCDSCLYWTLLCIEAADRMDVQGYTDTNVELKAQGIGNILSSLIGGLPMTSVVVRSSANNSAGAKSKMSAIIPLISVLAVPVIFK
jgi:hypothetical protein